MSLPMSVLLSISIYVYQAICMGTIHRHVNVISYKFLSDLKKWISIHRLGIIYRYLLI